MCINKYTCIKHEYITYIFCVHVYRVNIEWYKIVSFVLRNPGKYCDLLLRLSSENVDLIMVFETMFPCPHPQASILPCSSFPFSTIRIMKNSLIVTKSIVDSIYREIMAHYALEAIFYL